MNTSFAARGCRWQALPIILTALLCAGRAVGAPQGELDVTFGENGRMIIQVADSKFGSAISRQPADGKLLLPGYYSGSNGGLDFAVLRLNSDGSADDSFGSHGIAIMDFGNFDAVATELAVQADGGIIVAGSARSGPGQLDFALARLNADGTLDSTFGGDGLVTLDLGGVAESISGIVLLQSGEIVTVGMTDANGDQDAAFLRFGSNGALDSSFGAGPIAGSTIVGANGRTDELYSLIRQPDGKLVACGTTVYVDNGVDLISNMLAVRVNPDGSVDLSFGSNGSSEIAGDWQFASAEDCAALPNGVIVLAGFGGDPGFSKPTLVRLLPDGRPDTAFGNAGISKITVGRTAWARAIVRLDDGALGVTGSSLPLERTSLPTDLFVARLDAASGQLDAAFGDQGATIVDFGRLSQASIVDGRGLIAQADGKLIAVGDDLRSSLALARLSLAITGNAGFAGFVETSAQVVEGADLVITVRRTGGGTGSLSVDYDTIAGTAIAPGDMTAVSGTLTWMAGDMASKSIAVPIANDGIAESAESFSVVLSNSSNGLAASQFVVDIASSDTGGSGSGGSSGGGGGITGIQELTAMALIWAFAMRQRRREYQEPKRS